MDKRERFEELLKAKGLGEVTLKAYLYYYDALQQVLQGSGRDLDQEVINAFLTAFNNASPCRALLKIYITEERRNDLTVPLLTGRKAKKKRKFISPEEVKLIGDLLRKQNRLKFYYMLWLTYSCALRRKETVNVRVDDFNWSQWKLTPNQSGKLKVSFKGAKGMKERFVIVPSWLMKGLYVFVRDVINKLDDEDPLFSVGMIRWHQVFTKACEEATKKKCSLHDLRFSRATQWYKDGKDIRQIKIRLGHSRIETTMRYIDPAEEEELATWESED